MATATYTIQGSFTSGGVAYDLQLPIRTIQTSTNSQIATQTTQPSLVKFQCWNFTQWAVASKTIKSYWFKGMADANALLETNNATPVMVSSAITTNGFTIVNNTPLYGVEVTAITKANPGVVTFRGPGFNPGQGISTWGTGDIIKFSQLGGSSGTDWSNLNGTQYTVTKVSSNTFSFGVDTSAYTGTYTASSGIAYRIQDAAGNKIPPLNVANVGIRLGTSVVGADNDVIYWEATISDDSRALGDIGA